MMKALVNVNTSSAIFRGAKTMALVASLLLVGASPSAFAQCPSGIGNMSPAGGATNVPSTGQFSWTVSNGGAADFFNVFFGPAGQGCSAAPNVVTSRGGSSFALNYEDLAPNTSYEWRVEAVKNGCPTVTSSCATFQAGPCSKTAPNLISPAEGATADHLKVKFDWDPVFGATGYNVIVDGSSVGTTTSATTLTVDVPPGTHVWAVEALFGATCPAARSAGRTFGTACPTGSPNPVSPVAGQTLSSPQNIRFEWNGVSGSDGYNVFVQNGSGSPQQIGQTREGVNLAATNITATLPGPGIYTWFVDALSSSCPTIRGASGTFTVVDVCPKNAPNNLTTSITGTTVTFNWSANGTDASAAGLTAYKVWASISGAAPIVVATNTPGASTPAATTATAKFPAGTHSFFVEATFKQCASLSSATVNFTVTAPPACPANGPTLTSPAQGATNVASPVSFSWSSVAGAEAYQLFAGLNGATPALAITTTGNTKTSASALIGQGSVEWFVVAIVPGCSNINSARANFTTAAPTCPSAGPGLVEPAAGVTITRAIADPPISFIWTPVTGATSYTVSIVVNGPNGRTINASVTGQTIFQTGDLLSFLPASDVAPRVVEWFVTANFSGCPAVLSERRTFNIIQAPPCVLVPPTPNIPAGGSSSTNNTVQFSWSAVDGASEYRIYARTDPNSSDLKLAGRVSGETTISLALPFGPNQWVVEAVSPNCPPVSSQPVSFTINRALVCNTKAVTLVSPNAGQGVSNPVQFIWKAVSGATGYRVWVVSAGGTPERLANITDPSVLTATGVVPEGDVDWFVESVFPGCDSALSERRRISVAACKARPATLTSPSEAADKLTSPINFSWTPVTGATSYDIYVGVNGNPPQPIASIPVPDPAAQKTELTATVKTGAVTWFVRAFVSNCSPRESAEGHFTVVAPPACTTPATPSIEVQGEVTSNQGYPVAWTAVANANLYEIQESLTPDFSNALTQTVNSSQTFFSHEAPVETFYYYRVRAKSSCNATISAYSGIVTVRVKPSSSANSAITVNQGSQQVILQQIFLPGNEGVTVKFSATTDKPWVKVSPSSGDLPPQGVTLTLTADPRDLQPGANGATVFISYSSGKGGIVANGVTPPSSIPISVSLVPPVAQKGRSAPPPDALIIPAVASTSGANNSRFLSDVRLTNTSAGPVRYNVIFTPTATDARRGGKQLSLDVPGGQTIALDNILRSWFGFGAEDSISGALEIRPLSTGPTSSALTRSRFSIASSRTYNMTADGTYGQFIPAVPFSEFVGQGKILSMIQVAETSQFRTNLGLVEGAGEPATVRVTALGATGNTLAAFDVNLLPGEQRQLNQVLRTNNVTSDNVRLDVQVTSATGKITAYASVIDNQTNDPLLVSPKIFSTLSETNQTLPGIADLNTGLARWRSDITISNGGSTPVTATLTFYPTEDSTNTKSVTQTLAAGETKQLPDVLNRSFGLNNTGGAVHVTTAVASPLMVTARTYNETGKGTYGQYIPAVSVKDGLGQESGSLQVQQLEESPAFRSNLGLFELSGQPVTLEVTGIKPDSKDTPRMIVKLRANEFRQFNSIWKSLGETTIYNGRIAVRVIEGDGKVGAYGSVVDNKTQDPTYVPGER